MKWNTSLSGWILPLSSGVLLGMAFYPSGCGWLAWIALLPLLWSAQELRSSESKKDGFIKGCGFGVCAAALQFHWLGEVSWLAALLLVLYLALYGGIFNLALIQLWRFKVEASFLGLLLNSLVIGAGWALLEVVRSYLFGGFGWNALGVAMYQQMTVSQLADLSGVVGISFFLVVAQALWMAAIHCFLIRKRVSYGLGLMLFSVCWIGGGWMYGSYRMHQLNQLPMHIVTAGLIQINIPQDAAKVLWEAEDVHSAYEEETLQALDKFKVKHGGVPDLIMWPEAALTGRIMRASDETWAMWQDDIFTLERIFKDHTFHLIYGSIEMEAESIEENLLVAKENGMVYNSIAMFQPPKSLQTYQKQHLVIFGETIPIIGDYQWFRTLYQTLTGVPFHGSFNANQHPQSLAFNHSSGRIDLIPSICFEDTVPRVIAPMLSGLNPQLLVNVTNDGWFKESIEAEQHFANASFRCIEFRRPMIRCANTGVSAAVSILGSSCHPKTGEVQELRDQAGNHFTRGHRWVEVLIPQKSITTLYMRLGDLGVALYLSSFVLIHYKWGRQNRSKK